MQVFHDSLCWVWLVWDYNLTAAFEDELCWQYSRLLQTYTIIKSIKCGTFHYPSCVQFYQDNSDCEILVWFGGGGGLEALGKISTWVCEISNSNWKSGNISHCGFLIPNWPPPNFPLESLAVASMHCRKLGGNLRMRVKFCMMSTTEHIWLDELGTDKGLCQFPVKPSPQPEEKSCQLPVEPSLYPKEKNCQKTNIIETRGTEPSTQDHSPHCRYSKPSFVRSIMSGSNWYSRIMRLILHWYNLDEHTFTIISCGKNLVFSHGYQNWYKFPTPQNQFS